ncbi:MAG TPA: hypothetical protein VL263_06800 [Vicinamibacterales bacterium]|nr:hypothetical protein [Vicinamibacterales bacterium]
MTGRFDVLSRAIGGVAALAGAAAAIVYTRAGLALSHYDAKAHLVVARRIFDSITPGWEQIGAVWLPLPHVLNALPVQVDLFYRTGWSAIALSVAAMGLGAAAMSAIVLRLTGSRAGALTSAALFVSNPNVLYLHATPMTEPLLFGTTLMTAWLLTDWATSETLEVPRRLGWWMVAASLTRYEAWPVVGALVVIAIMARRRRGAATGDLVRAFWQLARYPIGAAAFFVVLSRVTVGEWFVSSGFFVPDATLQGQPGVVFDKILEGTRELGGVWLVRLALGAAAVLGFAALRWRQGAALLVPLGLFAAAALPFSAFLSGHPFRIRYEIPLVVASALAIGLAVSLSRRAAPVVAVAALILVARDVQPLDSTAPVIVEAQLDRINSVGRQAVTACLARDYHGETIFASMGSLAHYMQELSQIGLGIHDFLHEGNHPMWDEAIANGGAPFAGWMLVEEVAEGGDVIARQIRANPHFSDGYQRVCEGGNVALYRRLR